MSTSFVAPHPKFFPRPTFQQRRSILLSDSVFITPRVVNHRCNRRWTTFVSLDSARGCFIHCPATTPSIGHPPPARIFRLLWILIVKEQPSNCRHGRQERFFLNHSFLEYSIFRNRWRMFKKSSIVPRVHRCSRLSPWGINELPNNYQWPTRPPGGRRGRSN